MKVLVATEKPFAAAAVEGIKKEIEGAGNELVLLEKYTEKAQLLDAVKDVDAMIIRSDKADAEVLDAAKNLKIIVRAIAFSVMFVFRHLITTVCVITLLIFAIVLIAWQPVLIMIVPGLYGLLWSAAVDRILKRYMREDEKNDDGVVDRWYLE